MKFHPVKRQAYALTYVCRVKYGVLSEFWKNKNLGQELKVLLKLKSLIRCYFTDLKYWKSNSNSRERCGKIARPQEALNYYSSLTTFNRFEKIKIGKKKVSSVKVN